MSLAALSCSVSPHIQDSSHQLPGQPYRLNVVITDDHFLYLRPIPPGRVVFDIYNAGTRPHGLVLFPEDPDAPPIDVQLRGSTRRIIHVIAQVFPLQPGLRGRFAVDLFPGTRYAFMSKVIRPDKIPDFLKGLATDFSPQAIR